MIRRRTVNSFALVNSGGDRMSILTSLLVALLACGMTAGQLNEGDRIAEYHRRNYTWPLNNFSPNTSGWIDLMTQRFAQVEELPTSYERYEGYYRTIHSAFVVPNFTEYGFGLGRCSEELLSTLRQAIRDGIPTARDEPYSDAIDAPTLPWLIDRPDLTARVLKDMQPYAEEWSGMELEPFGAYGFRVYRNQSQLHMHLDRMQTHIISFILHIDSSEDAEPWPIFIEDFNGTTHEVTLTPGDILFYESSKCFHGRPRRLNGSWYSSVFVHYYPKGWQDTNHDLEAHYAVPPRWSNEPPGKTGIPKMVLAGTSMKEPECPNDWCRTKISKKWSGPGEPGVWIAPNFERYPLLSSLELSVDEL
jgi:hypothetical protein